MNNIQVNPIDISILSIYLAILLFIGFVARRNILSHKDFFLAGKRLPAWVTGIAYVSANFGALEIVGGISNAAQYGLSTIHFNMIGAIPAMILLGVLLMPFYYSDKIRTVQEYFKLRFDKKTHLANSIIFVLAQISIAGINIYVLGILLHFLLGINLYLVMIIGATIVGIYIIMGGIISSIYTEVLQFMVISAGLLPIAFAVMYHLHIEGGIMHLINSNIDNNMLSTWQGTQIGNWINPLGDWFGIIFGECFVLGFGYWTTNFVEVQRAMVAKDINSARLTPLIGTGPKLLYGYLFCVLGLIAVILFQHEMQTQQYNNILPLMIEKYLPHGLLGLAVTAMIASFMTGISSNITGANIVLTYDIIEPYILKKKEGKNKNNKYNLLLIGKLVTIGIIIAAILTSFIASQYNNIQNYLQQLFGYFNTPVFITFICGVFYKKISNVGAFMGMALGPIIGITTHLILEHISYFYPNHDMSKPIAAQMQNFYTAFITAISTLIIIIIFSNFGKRNDIAKMQDLIWSKHVKLYDRTIPIYKQPIFIASIILIVCVMLSIQLYTIA